MLKVMLVDNETAIRTGLAQRIRWETLGCTVAAQACDGIDALEQIPAVLPDIVISDIRMPGMDGLELARTLCEKYPQIKVILLTGFPDFEYAQKAITYRVVDFVLKPTSVEKLAEAIGKARTRIEEERSRTDLRRELETQAEQNLALQRRLFLHDLIHRVDLSNLYVMNRMAQLGLDLRGYYVLQMAVSLSDSQADPLPSLREAQDILRACLEDYAVQYVPAGDRRCYAVVSAPSTSGLYTLCSETVQTISAFSRFSLTIGLSRHSCDPLRLADAAEEARQARQFADNAADQPVMPFERLPQITEESMREIVQDLQALKTAIENQNLAGAQAGLRKLFTYIREKRVAVEEVRNICVYVYNFCITQLFRCDAEGSLSENSLPTLKNLLESPSIDRLEAGMYKFVEIMLARTGSNTENMDALVLQIRNHIEEHYMEDLSLEGLAALAHLSPSYLSKLFKKESGENISAYVQNVRIERAKQLLLTTQLKTYEIAERIGIPDPVYFSRTFKKVTGLKPKDFRASAQESGT